MGYPMTYTRILSRNQLQGGYSDGHLLSDGKHFIRGDLRRLEADQRDALHLAGYARRAGITVDQARRVLDDLFSGVSWAEGLEFKEAAAIWAEHAENIDGGLSPGLMHGAAVLL